MRPGREVGFALAVAIVVVGLLAAPAALSAPDGGEEPAVESVDRTIERPAEPPESVTATVGDRSFESLQAALSHAGPGETVVLEGTVDASDLRIETDDLVLRGGDRGAVIDGGGEGDVLAIDGENVTVADLWIRESGHDADTEDAGVFVAGDRTALRNVTLTAVTFGIWVDGADEVLIEDSTVEGRESVFPLDQRGNGIHLWSTEGTTIADNRVGTVRDGIYYAWATDVEARNNTMWDSRYGVHYMYSNDNRLAANVAVDNDVGYALMVSEGILVEDNLAIGNAGTSGHGVLLKDIEDSTVRDNVLVENGNGLFVYNSQDNRLAGNLVVRNAVGIERTAGSDGQTVVGNSFVGNDRQAASTAGDVASWNGTERGNYWSDARTVDLTGDGVSEVRHRPAGIVEHLVAEQPRAAVFAESPAFDAVALAESSFPVLETPGIVDRRPLVEPPHDNWTSYGDHG